MSEKEREREGWGEKERGGERTSERERERESPGLMKEDREEETEREKERGERETAVGIFNC